MKIYPGPESLTKLFEGSVEVSVPSFQRNFVWKQEQLKQYLDDLFGAAETDDTHFFGPIVIFDATEDSSPIKKYELVDGQQRITTSVMLISILRDMLFDKRYFQNSMHGAIDLSAGLKQILFGGDLAATPKFKAGFMIRKYFYEAVILDPKNKLQKISSNGAGMAQADIAATKELRKAHMFIESYLRDKFDPMAEPDLKELYSSLIKSLSSRFQIHSLVVKDEMDAYQLFESINYLGFKLEPGDLLKSLTLRKIQVSDSSNLSQGMDDWDTLVKNLEGYSLSKFLRHYLLSEKTGKVQASKIFKIFKEDIEASPTSARATLTKLMSASKLYSHLLNGTIFREGGEKLAKVARRLNLMSETHRVLLLSIALHPKLTTTQMEKAFRAAEFFVFRAVAARENRQDVENIYQDFGHKLKVISTDEALNEWCDQLVAKAINDDALRNFAVKNSPFVGIQHDSREDLGRYAIACLEDDLGGGWSAAKTLEHLAPQNPKAGSVWFAKVGNAQTEYSVYTHWWGNFTWLEGELNSKIQNAPWPQKIAGDPAKNLDGLSKSGFFLTKRAILVPDWTSEVIQNRGNWILETFLEIRSASWVSTGSHQGAQIPLWPLNV
jgi:hypothetical protein